MRSRVVLSLVVAAVVVALASGVPGARAQFFGSAERARLLAVYANDTASLRRHVGHVLQRAQTTRDALAAAPSSTPPAFAAVLSQLSTADDPCPCECNPDGPFWEFGAKGYGRYCGAGYYCKQGEAACDAADACCKAHDACIVNYCDSCECNTVLAECLAPVSGDGGGFCDKQQEARHTVLSDICFVLRHAPSFCGGCAAGTPLPPVCNDF